MVERGAGNGDAGIAHVREIRQPHPAGLVHLPEDDLALGAMDGAPGTDAPFQGPADSAAQFGVGTGDLLENGNEPQARGSLQHGHDLGLENIGQRIGTTAFPRRRLLRRQPRVLLDAIGRGDADRRLGEEGRISLSGCHPNRGQASISMRSGRAGRYAPT